MRNDNPRFSTAKKILILFIVIMISLAGYVAYSSFGPAYSLKYPGGWKITELPKPQNLSGDYKQVKIQSPDFVGKPGDSGRTAKGAEFQLLVYSLPESEKDDNVDKYINRTALYTAQGKEVTLGGQKAAEYIDNHSEPYNMVTVTYKDGVKYELTYKDIDGSDFQKYLTNYRDLVKSFRFK